jgi:hypothetical protein
MCSRSVRLALAVVLMATAAGCGGGGDRRASSPTPTAAPSRSPASAPQAVARSGDAVLSWLKGRRVTIERRTVRIDSTTLTCAGLGRASRVHGRRAWSRFRCVQPTLPPGSVAGPDAIFFVEPTGPRTFAVVDGRFTAY